MIPILPSPPLGIPPHSFSAQDPDSEFNQAQLEARRRIVLPRVPSFEPLVPSNNHDEFDRQQAHAEFDRLQAHAEFDRLQAHAEFDRLKSIARESSSLGRTTVLLRSPPPIKRSIKEQIRYEINHRHAMERAMMAGVAVCLLWLTSLTVAQSIVYNLIRGPDLETVMHLTENAVNSTSIEKENYYMCAKRRAQECNLTYARELDREVTNCNRVLDQNRQVIDSITTQRGNCSNQFGYVISSLDQLGLDLQPNFTLVPNLSLDSRCVTVEKVLADQIASIRAQSVAEIFQASADEKVSSLHSQYRARAQYDLTYSLNATIGLVLGGEALNTLVSDPQLFFQNMSVYRDQLFACLGAGATNSTCNNPTLVDQVALIREQMIQNYNTQRTLALDASVQLLKDFKPLQLFYNQFRDAMRFSVELKNSLDSATNQNGGGGGNGLAGIGFVDMDIDIPPLSLDSALLAFHSVDDLSGATAMQVENQNRMIESQRLIQEQMERDHLTTTEGQLSWQATFFADYHPPPFDVDAEENGWKKTSSAFLPEIQGDLSLVAKRVVEANDTTDEFKPSSNTSESGKRAQDILQDFPFSPIHLYSYGNIDPRLMLGQWNQITNLALIMDYMYRILRSISIIRQYMKISEVLAPPADMRIGTKTKSIRHQTPDQVMARLLTHPGVNLGMALIFIGICSSLFLKLYLPFFNEYSRGCNGNGGEEYWQESNGTMITRNANTIALQVASGKGDSITSTEIDRINVQRELDCSKNSDLVTRQQKRLREENAYTRGKFTDLMEQVTAFQDCIRVTAVDLQLNGTRVHDALFSPLCDQSGLPQLDPYEFQCSNIDICRPECIGPNKLAIEKATMDAGCTGEHYIHSGILGTALSAMTFTLMNLSRWTFLRGLRRALLSYFAVGDFSYLGSTTADGDSASFTKEEIRKELAKTIRNYERTGMLICGIGLMINLPWVIGLVKFAENL